VLCGEDRTVGWAVLWPVGLVLRMGVVIGKVRRGSLLMTNSSVSFCIEHYIGVRIARCYARLVPYRENASHDGRVYCTSLAYFESILIKFSFEVYKKKIVEQVEFCFVKSLHLIRCTIP
jgi:hypothetical protein